MPCIKTIDSIKIYIHYREHNPPHFHAHYNEYVEVLEIKTLKKIVGYLPKNQRRKVLNWARSSKDFLMRKWNEFRPDS